MHARGLWWVFSLLVCTRLGSCWCAFFGFRPSGVNLLGLYQPDHLEDNLAVHYTAVLFGDWVYFSWGIFLGWKLYMLALVGQPSLHGYYACMVFWNNGALWRNCRLKQCKTSFSPCCVFLCSRYSFKHWWGKVLSLLWVGRARHPGPLSGFMSVEVFNVGGWLTHGDLALEADVDFLAVVEHRLVPARVRGEWARLRNRGASSVWSPASQESSHVGHGGVGVVSLKGAPLSLPASATAQFRRFFDCGRALRCVLPIASGRFLHLVVLYGYHGADRDAEQLSLTDQLFDAALGEVGVVALDQPCLIVGDFNVEPTKFPCLSKGIFAGLWVDLESAWAFASGVSPAVTCKRAWDILGGIVGILWLVVLSLRLRFVLVLFSEIGGLFLIWLFVPLLLIPVGLARFRSLLSVLHFGLLLGCLLLIRLVVLSLLRFRGFGRFMMNGFSSCLGEMLLVWIMHFCVGDVSSAWKIWSSAAESALADAFRFAGGPVPTRGLVLGRGMVRIRTVRLGGPIVRSIRRSAVGDGEFDDVSLYRDSSAAPVLDLRRNLEAILDLLDSITRFGASLARDVQLVHLWDSVVRLRSLGSVHVREYEAARVCVVCESRRIVAELHGRVFGLC